MNETVLPATRETEVEPVLWALIGLYALARVLQVFPGRIPIVAVVGLHVVCPATFALIHGAKLYGWRGIGLFVGVSLLVGNIFENLGVLTGFPFGHYYFTGVMGPKLFHVPILLGLAYVGMGYLSWMLARVILGSMIPLEGPRVVLLPLAASFLMVAWDFSQEPIWATVVKAWIWVGGGPYFGVPLSNFAGWFLVVYLVYQLFALYLKGREDNSGSQPLSSWRLPVLFYAVSAAGNLLLLLMPRAGLSLVSDSTGALWKVRDITGTCALVSIFTMGAFALLGWARLPEQAVRE